MGKVLVLLLVVVVALAVMSIVKRNRMTSSRAAPQLKVMKSCAHCGLLVEAEEAGVVAHEGQVYCSEAHRHLGPKVS
jgi:hypothetical protein